MGVEQSFPRGLSCSNIAVHSSQQKNRNTEASKILGIDPGSLGEEDWRESWRRGLARHLAKRIGEEKDEEKEKEKEEKQF